MKRIWAVLALCLLIGCQADLAESSSPTPVAASAQTMTQTQTATVELTVSTPLPTPSFTPTPTPEPSSTPEPTAKGLMPWTQWNRFTDEGSSLTDTEYRSPNVSITLNKVEDTARTGKSLVYFVADIYLKDVHCFRRAQSGDDFCLNETEAMNDFSHRVSALVSISGDYCGTWDKALAVVNGEVVFDAGTYNYVLCVLYEDGSMELIPAKEIDSQAILAKKPWQTWNFGPILVQEPRIIPPEYNQPDTIEDRNPRAVLGYYEPGHYCFVLVEGRQRGYSMGLNLQELSQLMLDLGCVSAYNLDGGISAQMAWMGKRINHPGGNRSLRDIAYIAEPLS